MSSSQLAESKSRKKKRRQRTGPSAFILDEAEVDDEAEEEEEYDDLIEEDDLKTVERHEADIYNHRRGRMLWEDKSEEEVIRHYSEKFAHQSEAERDLQFGDSEELNEEITQAALMPTVKDPNLWMVKCQIGQEKATVLTLMRKYNALKEAKTNEPLQIKSIIAPEAVKGYIYIEAYKQTHVKQAIDGISNLRLGMHKQQMVPINEMTDVLRVVKEHPRLKKNQFVRLKRTIYKGDLAQVDYVDSNNIITLRLKPRIDYTKLRGALRDRSKDKELGTKKPKFKRPPQKLFDVDSIRAIGGEVTTDGDFRIFEGNRYRRGLLYKNFPLDAIIVDGVKPTIAELESTEEQSIDDAELQLGADRETKFSPGDKVEVAEGELIHLQGKVLAVDGSRITMQPNHEELTDPLQFPASELKKFFDEGDHVKVIDGRHDGDTGIIVSVEDKNAVLISDISMDEIKVLVRDLQLCQDRATGVDSLGQFSWGDLVQIDPQLVGVIVRLERENLQVLLQTGKVKQFKSQAVTKKTDAARRAVALDNNQNQMHPKDQVKVLEGFHRGKTAEVKHIFRSWVFLHSRLVTENGGIFVCKPRMLQLVGSTGTTRPSAQPMSTGLEMMSPRIQSPQHPSGGTPSAGFRSMPPNRTGGRDPESLKWIGKTIKIVKGSYKGHIGIVKDAIGTNARIELHSDPRTIIVAMTNIRATDGQTPQIPTSYNRSTPSFGSQTPSHGSRTPAHIMQTPIYEGSATPMHTTQTPRADFDVEEVASPKQPSYITPSYNVPETPNATYAPQTPGLYSGNDYNSYSPFPVQSPANAQFAGNQVQSPANFMTSSFRGPSSAAPFNSYSAMTPGPTSMMSHQPQTPGAGMEVAHDWQTPDLIVSIESSRNDPSNKNQLAGQIGYITSVSGNVTNVFLFQEERCVSITSSDLAPVAPTAGDRFKVIDGDHRDSTGTVVSIDGPDCVCKLDNLSNVTFLPIKNLCKLKS